MSKNKPAKSIAKDQYGEGAAPRVRWFRDCSLALLLAVLLLLAGDLVARYLVAPPAENENERPEAFDVPPKAQGTYRILTVGGSTVAGWPMPELGFAAQLEALLRRVAPERPVEVVNLGYLGKSSVYVRRMVEQAAAYEPDLLVIMSGHNEFLNRTEENSSVTGRLRRAVSRIALVRLLRGRLSASEEPPLSPNYYLPERLIPYDRESEWFADRIALHRKNLERAIAWARAREVPVLLCTLPSNLADWPPVHHLVAWASRNPSYDEDVAAIEAQLQASNLTDAERLADSVLARYGEDAMILFLKGQICRRAGRSEEALALLTRAKDLDPFPQRALNAVNVTIRQLADGDGVYLVDLERDFASEAPGGIPGWDLIADNVHPTSQGYALIAGSLAEALAKHGLFLNPDMKTLLPTSPAQGLEVFLASIPSESLKKWMKMKVAIGHSKYCQKYPFFFFERALFYQREVIANAQSIRQDHWAFHGELGTLLVMTGHEQEGIEELRLATRLKGSPMDPKDHGSVNWLPEALARIGQTPETLAAP